MAHGFLSYDPLKGESPLANWLQKKLEKKIQTEGDKLWNKFQKKFAGLFDNKRDTTYRGLGKGRLDVTGPQDPIGGGLLSGSQNRPLLGGGKGGITKLDQKRIVVGKNPTDIDNKEQQYNNSTNPDAPRSRKGGTFTNMAGVGGLSADNFFLKAQTGVGDSGEYLTKAQRVADFQKSRDMRGSSDSGADIVAAMNRNTAAIINLIDVTGEQIKNDTNLSQQSIQAQETLLNRQLARQEEKSLEGGNDLSGFLGSTDFKPKKSQGGGGGGMPGMGGLLSSGLGILGGAAGMKMLGKRGISRVLPRLATKFGGKQLGKRFIQSGAKNAIKKTTAKQVTKQVGKNVGKKVAAKGLGKMLGKKIPIVGLGLGALFAAQRAMAGDWTGAGMELASGAASTIPGFGTAGSLAIDAALMGRDMGLMDGESNNSGGLSSSAFNDSNTGSSETTTNNGGSGGGNWFGNLFGKKKTDSGSSGGSAKIAAAAKELQGMSTASGPDGGKNGCVWAVNKVFNKAGIKPPWGSSLWVPDAEKSMINSGWKAIPYDQQQPGDVFVMKDKLSPPQVHIGVATDNENILSNSSGKASMSWIDDAEGYNEYYGGEGVLYRMPGGVAPSSNGTNQKSQAFTDMGNISSGSDATTGGTGSSSSPNKFMATSGTPDNSNQVLQSSSTVSMNERQGSGGNTVVNNYYSGGGEQQGVNPNGVSAGISMDGTGTSMFQDLKIRTLS